MQRARESLNLLLTLLRWCCGTIFCQGFVLVYSITDDSTFEDLVKIREQILGVHPDKYVPMMLLGNKSDLESERAVTQEEAKKRAKEFGREHLFIEASAKANKNVREAFELIMRCIMERSSDPTKGGGGAGVMGAGQAPKPAAAPAEKKRPCVLL